MRILPTLVDPVKESLSTNVLSQSALPISDSFLPRDETKTLITPFGIPASSAKYAKANALNGAS